MIFLSHSSADDELANHVCSSLEQAGHACWMAPRDIPAGSSWPEQIAAAIERSELLLLLLTQASNNSEHVLREVELAVRHGIGIVSFKCEQVTLTPGLQYLLSSVQGIDGTSGSVEAKAAQLSKALTVTTDKAATSPNATTTFQGGRARHRRLIAYGVFLLGLGAMGLLVDWHRIFGSSSSPAPNVSNEKRATVLTAENNAIPAPIRLPPGAEKLPAARVLRTVYSDSPPPSDAPGQAGLSVDVLVQKSNERTRRPIGRDEALKSQVDVYEILVTTTLAGYLYVFQIDSRGNTTWLYPRNDTSEYSSGSNPLEAGEVQIPGGTNVLFLDNAVGVEHVFVVFSKSRWQALEKDLEATKTSDGSSIVLDTTRFVSRGVGGTKLRPEISDRQVQYQDASLKVVFNDDRDAVHLGTGDLLVVQRRFRHE